jgi:hypothetical protein
VTALGSVHVVVVVVEGGCEMIILEVTDVIVVVDSDYRDMSDALYV